jgi:GGDEF domain-containing protein
METRSAIAVPVGGEQGMAVGVLYIASKQEKAFGEADLPALRVIARMVEELLPTYWARQQFKGRLSDLINYPHVIDLAFRDFKSEDDFINDVEELLTTIQSRGDIQAEKRPDPAIKPEEVVSFIEVDIDNQAELAKKYGDLVARNLSRDVGLRILGLLRLQSNPGYKRVYHINADRYYMMFPGMPLNEALKLAETLREDLAAEYSIDAQRVVVGRPLSHKDLLVLQNVTVRLGVQSFQYAKLKDLLGRQPADAVAEVRALIVNHADEFLKAGQAEGGNCIIAWRYDTWTFGRWSPVEAST